MIKVFVKNDMSDERFSECANMLSSIEDRTGVRARVSFAEGEFATFNLSFPDEEVEACAIPFLEEFAKQENEFDELFKFEVM